MKRIWIVALVLGTFFACQNKGDESANGSPETETIESNAPSMAHFGNEINEVDAKPVNEALALLAGGDSIAAKITGTIDKVCQAKGCWMTMAYGEGESMRVTFRDYGFFVPKDVDGKEAVVEGTLYMETTSVEDLQHFAEDEGLSEEEIAAITEPETALTFVADGVIIKDYKVSSQNEESSDGHNHHHHDHNHSH